MYRSVIYRKVKQLYLAKKTLLKSFFYLPGREEETIGVFFREKPDRVIDYKAIEELSYLFGIKISNKDQRKLPEKIQKETYSVLEK